MSHQRKAAAQHAAAMHARTAERVLWLPQLPPDDASAGGPDPARPPVEISATVNARPRVIEREGANANSAEAVMLASAKWRVSYPQAGAVALRAGDHVQRLDEPGRPILRLAQALPIRGRVIHPADEVA